MSRSRIRERRKALEWTVAELSRRAGVKEDTVRDLEKRARKSRHATLVALDVALRAGEHAKQIGESK